MSEHAERPKVLVVVSPTGFVEVFTSGRNVVELKTVALCEDEDLESLRLLLPADWRKLLWIPKANGQAWPRKGTKLERSQWREVFNEVAEMKAAYGGLTAPAWTELMELSAASGCSLKEVAAVVSELEAEGKEAF